ncbi:MAG: helix-turn-helix transcriptional regulator [Synergistaceae bacterium]|nr:helix-turn-helix transcriptional regulator [Synergistaceae bacterium]
MRKNNHMTQQEIAQAVGTSFSTYRRWEKDSQLPNMKLLSKLATVLNTTVAYLSGETDNPNISEVDTNTPNTQLSPVSDPTFSIKKSDIIGNKEVLFYENNGQCFSLPATPENEKWFREFLNSKM